MKTSTIYRFTIALSLSLLSFGSFSQCSPNPIYTLLGIPGIWPNAMQGDLNGTENDAFSQVFTVIPPTDTTVNLDTFSLGNVNVPINHVSVTGIAGLPNGLSYTCNNTNCQWALGTNGCFIIDGTPTESGTFTVTVTLTTNVEVPFVGGFDLPGFDIDYTLIIAPTPVGIETKNNYELSIEKIAPNPFSEKAIVQYTNNGNEDLILNLYNSIGTLVSTTTRTPQKGQNEWIIDGNGLSPGTYMATISNGKAHHTTKVLLLK
jgi:hypothetical protein